MSIARYEIYDNIGSMYELCSYYDNGVIMNELCSYISCMTFIMIPSERCFFYLPVWLHVVTSTMMIIMMIIIIMAQEAGGRGGGRVDLPN